LRPSLTCCLLTRIFDFPEPIIVAVAVSLAFSLAVAVSLVVAIAIAVSLDVAVAVTVAASLDVALSFAIAVDAVRDGNFLWKTS